MKPIGILYATCEGHTERIAGQIAKSLYARGFAVEMRNLQVEASSSRTPTLRGIVV